MNVQNRQIRIVLADDQPVIRQGMRYIIGSQSDMEVVGEASSGEEALSVTELLKPDLVLMDIRMPGLSGIEATRLLHAAHPEIKVMLLTTFDVQSYVVDGIRAGAVGYLLKDAETRTLLDSIRSAYRGAAIYQSSTASKAMAEAMKGGELQDFANLETDANDRFRESLTEKELDVLQWMAYGLRNAEIAQRLYVSEGTVKTHVHRILGKLGAADRTQAVVLAIRQKMVK
ncbi:response regulator [Paenibacillus flagellatus]|uniref:DNA-binding response regulator n=1 Tax=Paenibacillus flagellatus TaxID=2211139 RepID=A0A2V5K2P0_9BACL|nr:response regulator transcription factor [Paenibacillus flagellatus]PYI52034.1 DNA-binding response regulator [Paenibacillus flagellatus]